MNNKDIETQVIKRVIEILGSIIDDNHPNDSDSFKVRPDYGYAKYYLTHVEGDYDMSLHSLIHYILYEEQLYNKFLTSKRLNDVKEVIKEYPESIYSPDCDEEGYEIVQDSLDWIYYKTISFVGKRLKELGYDVSEFDDYLK